MIILPDPLLDKREWSNRRVSNWRLLIEPDCLHGMSVYHIQDRRSMSEDISSELVIQETTKAQCTLEQKRTLMALTFRGDSGMRSLWASIDGKRKTYDVMNHRVFIAYHNGKIIGWGLLYRDGILMDYYAMFYVALKYRRKKVGSTLFKKIKQYCDKRGKDLFVYDEQPEFFTYCGVPESLWT